MWSWTFAVDRRSGVPLAAQIERAVIAAVRDGRLGPGANLPSSRALAGTLGVTRNTVVAAYRELAAQGWLDARPGGRTSISAALPEPLQPARPAPRAPPAVPTLPDTDSCYSGRFPASAARSCGPWDAIGSRYVTRSSGAQAPFPLLRATHRDPIFRWRLGAGEPDLRLIPADALARAMRRAMSRGRAAVLGYRDPRGLPELLDGIAGWLGATRGIATDRARLLATHGAQQALDLLARSLVRPGDRVAVEALGYPPAWRVFDLAGARRVVLPVDDQGVRVDALEQALRDGPIRAVYLTPHHQYPTTVTLAPARRLALLALARARGIAVIEDDYDHEFHFDGPPRLPLAASDPDVFYVGTFSKVLAPGLRLGFLHGPPAWVEVAASIRMASDRQGDGVVERAVAELIEGGELQRHIRRMRRIYLARRDHLVGILRAELGSALTFDVPTGGIGLWARVDPGIDDELWVRRAQAAGVGLRAGREFSAEGAWVPGLRMVYSRLDEPTLTDAVRALAQALATRG